MATTNRNQPEDAAADGVDGGREITTGYFSVSDLATRHGVPRAALEKRLERWRRRVADGYVENRTRGCRKPRYLYQESAVMPVIKELQAKG